MSRFKNCRLFFCTRPQRNFIPTLIAANRSKLQQIYKHPFNQHLFAGTLPQLTFGHYLRDDFLYLRQFSLAILNIANRTTQINPNLSHQLSALAHDVINNEQKMQLRYRVHFENLDKHRMGDTVTEYSKFLIASSLQDEVPVALSCVLPCFWIYYQLGILARSPAIIRPNPYHDWIATYSSTGFIKVTKALATTVNLMGNQSTEPNYSQMKASFSRSVGFELDFFEEVYQRQLRKNDGVNLLCKFTR